MQEIIGRYKAWQSGSLDSHVLSQVENKMVFMASIVTYDVLEKHLELRKALLDLGYSTTLYHATKTPEEVTIDVQNICEKLQIHLAKCVATDLIKWHVIRERTSVY